MPLHYQKLCLKKKGIDYLARVFGKFPSNWLEESILQPLIHSTASKIATKMPSFRWFKNDEQLNALQGC
jgi:hypothetical protein